MTKIVAILALYVNPFLAMWFFAKCVQILKKVKEDLETEKDVIIGSLLLGWLVFSTVFFLATIN